MTISFLFSMLGWRLSKEKLLAYDSVCKVLGVQLDLGAAVKQLVSNTDERVTELVAEIEAVLARGTLTRKDGERLTGRLQFASGQLFGRLMRNHLKRVSDHLKIGRKAVSNATSESLCAIKEALKSNIPRRVSGRIADFIHVYVDASFEKDGYSGVGGVVYVNRKFFGFL